MLRTQTRVFITLTGVFVPEVKKHGAFFGIDPNLGLWSKLEEKKRRCGTATRRQAEAIINEFLRKQHGRKFGTARSRKVR